MIDCVRALEIAGSERREDWYWTMSAVLLSREEQRPIFDQAFRVITSYSIHYTKLYEMHSCATRPLAPV